MMVEMERVWISLYGGYAHLRTKPTGHPPTVGTTVGWSQRLSTFSIYTDY